MSEQAVCHVCAGIITLVHNRPRHPAIQVGKYYFCTPEHHRQAVRRRIEAMDKVVSANP